MFLYFDSVNKTIYNESAAHLAEIYHQANQSFSSHIDNTWSSLHAWEPYLREAESDSQKVEYIEKLQQEGKFTDFYFINDHGSYMTADGRSGYIDLKDKLEELVEQKKDVVIYSVVPGKPEIILFAVPAEGTFSVTTKDHSEVTFGYHSIAISFDNAALIQSLKLEAYEGSSGSYVVNSDGRVLVDNTPEAMPTIHNFLAMLRSYTDLKEKQLAEIEDDFQHGKSGATTFSLNGVRHYLVYQSVGFEEWMLLGVVPASVVNSSMINLQVSSVLFISSIALILAIVLGVFVIWRYRRNI